MKSKYKFIQVYNVWVNGRSIDDVDQHFPIDTNIDRHWYSDFKKATQEYFKAKALPDKHYENPKEIFQDYVVTLFSIDIDIKKFEKKYNLKFNIENDDVQDMIPYYVNYGFNTVAERICKFK